jgi:cytochrome c553
MNPFFSAHDFQIFMKHLVKISLAVCTIIALASCEKTEFDSVKPANAGTEQTYKTHQAGDDDSNSGDLFTDKDKCKKCHSTGGRSMEIDWTTPFMSDHRYNSIEELIENFDFVNDVHLPKGSMKPGQSGISEEEKAALISYLEALSQKNK